MNFLSTSIFKFVANELPRVNFDAFLQKQKFLYCNFLSIHIIYKT